MRTPQPLVDDTEELRTRNLQLADWERAGSVVRETALNLLDAKFQFRRGNGDVVYRDDYIASLTDPKNTSTELLANVVRIDVMGPQAFVEVHVFLDGTRDGNAVRGWFRNLRLWEKQSDGQWRCVFWFNKALPKA